MAIKGAKEIPKRLGYGPAKFQPSTITADLISHRLLSFSENFSHDPKGWKLLKI